MVRTLHRRALVVPLVKVRMDDRPVLAVREVPAQMGVRSTGQSTLTTLARLTSRREAERVGTEALAEMEE